MMAFGNLSSFVRHLVSVRGTLPAAEHRGLDKAGALVAKAAGDLIGHEQEAWAALADSTVAAKSARGQTGRLSPTDPLFATGEMRATISHEVDGRRVVIGSPDPVAVFQEFGTAKMPARSFLAGAMMQNAHAAANAVTKEIALAIAGKKGR